MAAAASPASSGDSGRKIRRRIHNLQCEISNIFPEILLGYDCCPASVGSATGAVEYNNPEQHQRQGVVNGPPSSSEFRADDSNSPSSSSSVDKQGIMSGTHAFVSHGAAAAGNPDQDLLLDQVLSTIGSCPVGSAAADIIMQVRQNIFCPVLGEMVSS